MNGAIAVPEPSGVAFVRLGLRDHQISLAGLPLLGIEQEVLPRASNRLQCVGPICRISDRDGSLLPAAAPLMASCGKAIPRRSLSLAPIRRVPLCRRRRRRGARPSNSGQLLAPNCPIRPRLGHDRSARGRRSCTSASPGRA